MALFIAKIPKFLAQMFKWLEIEAPKMSNVWKEHAVSDATFAGQVKS